MLKFLHVRYFLLLILFVQSIAVAEQRPYLISGFDDVLRQAENTSLLKASIKIFEHDKGFSGMPELYKVISHQEASPQFFLVSAISNWFDARIDKFLTLSNFPSNQRYLRNWFTEWSIESFKIEKIRSILSAKPDRQFIVIFDNSDASLHLAEKIHQMFAEKVIAIYLRQVQNKKIPQAVTEFYTAFDIAKAEFEKARLSKDEVSKVAAAILNVTDVHALIPSYASCPPIERQCSSQATEVRDLCLRVTQHMRSLCHH